MTVTSQHEAGDVTVDLGEGPAPRRGTGYAGDIGSPGPLQQWGQTTECSLQLDPATPFDAWAAIGQTLGTLGRAVPWYIGDWLRQGEHIYGETYAQAMDATGYSYQTLLNLFNVAKRVAPEVRVPSLSHSHHAEVARFEDAATQRAWLAKAVEGGWTKHQLREAIRASLLGEVEAVDPGDNEDDDNRRAVEWKANVRRAALAVFVRWNDTAREAARPLLPEEHFIALADAIAERAAEYAA